MIRTDDRLTRPFRLGMFLAAILAPLGSTMIAVALPGVGRELGADPARLNLWLVMSYLLVGIIAQGPGGMLGDRIGHERALVVGIGIYACGTSLGSIAAALPGLAVARILMAAGGAVTLPSTMALMRTRIPVERRARTFGIYSGALGLAAALGPILGGWVVTHFGWRTVFLANLPVLLVASLLVIRPAWQAATGAQDASRRLRPDLMGAALLILGLVPVIVSVSPASTLGAGAGCAGLAVLLLFAAWELRARDPIFDVRFFQNREFAAGSLVIALQNLVMYALLFEIPVALAATKSAHASKAEHLLFGMLGGMVLASPLGGRLAERAGARLTILAGSILALGGLALIQNPAWLQHPYAALPGLVLLGAGLGLSSGPAQSAAMSAIRSGRAGSAAGVLSTTRYFGGLAGIALLGACKSPAMLHHAYAITLGAALLISLWLLQRRGGELRDDEAACTTSELPAKLPGAPRRAEA